MTTAQQIVEEALSWKGTPVVHQQSQKGRGTDCRGLIAGVARELSMAEAESIYARMSGYHGVDVRLLKEGLRALFDEVQDMRPADVLLHKMAGKPQHLSIFTGERCVHALARAKVPKVVATPIEVALRAWPLDSVWRWRGVEWA